MDEKEKTVVITYFIDPGKKVYTRRINITGNSRTRDEVVRREFRQMEGSGFSREKLKLSRERAQRTGYFDRVTVKTKAVDSSNDEIDIDVEVIEKPSGALMAGIGFSQSSGVAFNASIRQNNFLGTATHTNQNPLIESDYYDICDYIRNTKTLNTFTGRNGVLQIRTKDSKPYHPIFWEGQQLSNKGFAFYLTGRYAKKLV